MSPTSYQLLYPAMLDYKVTKIFLIYNISAKNFIREYHHALTRALSPYMQKGIPLRNFGNVQNSVRGFLFAIYKMIRYS